MNMPLNKTYRRPGAQRGAVMVVTMFATVLLAGLLFFVVNLGRQVNDRVEVQHAADSAGEAGATWVARSLNTVARNNIAISRHIANVNTMDSLPDAVESSFHETEFLRDQLDPPPAYGTPSPRLNAVIREQLNLMIDNLAQEVDDLEPMAQFLDDTDVRELTHYQSPSGARGRLWQAMQSLDQYNQATMQQLGDLAHLNAAAGGDANLARENYPSSTVLLPVSPQLPVRRGEFDDFYRPVLAGQVPDEINDDSDHRGPYDTVFGWRRYHYERGDATGGPGSPGTTGGVSGGGGSPVGGGPGNHGPTGPTYEWQVIGYRTFGTQGRTWQSNPGAGWTYNRLSNFIWRRERINLIDIRSRFYHWVTRQADAKINYVWPHPRYPYGNQFARPVWNSSYPESLPDYGEDLPFSETGFFRLDIKSRYPRASSSFMAGDDSWAFEQHANRRSNIATNSNFFVVFQPGWWLRYRDEERRWQYAVDPLEINPYYPNGNFTSIGPRAWLNEFEYEVDFDFEIGIEPEYADPDPDVTGEAGEGEIVPQTAYFVQVVFYAGINTNPVRPGVFNPSSYARNAYAREAIDDDSLTWTVANPYEEFDKDSEDAPAPLDLNHDVVGVDSAGTDALLEYLAVTTRSDRALLWPRRFQGGKPYANIVSVAQAQVFNDHSWDLWTPMWQSRLQPVSDYGQWVDVLDDAVEDDEDLPSINADELASLRDFMRSTEALAPAMLSH